MEKSIQRIKYQNEFLTDSHFDLVSYQDVLRKTPTDHSQFENHKLSFYIMLLFTKGSGRYTVNFKDFDFKKGSLFTLRKDNVHKFYRTGAEGLLFVFTEEFISYYLSNTESSKIFLLFNELLSSEKVQLNDQEYSEVCSLTELIKSEYHRGADIHSPYIIRNLLLSIFNKLLRIKIETNMFTQGSKYLSKFLIFQKLVEEGCFTSRKVSYYADQMHITSKTLNTITQSVIHKSAKLFINDTLIINIKRLIINSQDTLSEISYAAGFDEPTNFFKYFTKYAGISPKDFRETL